MLLVHTDKNLDDFCAFGYALKHPSPDSDTCVTGPLSLFSTLVTSFFIIINGIHHPLQPFFPSFYSTITLQAFYYKNTLPC